MCISGAIFEYEEKENTLESSKRYNKKDKIKKNNYYKEEQWCHYGGLPSPMAYMDE